MLATHGEYPFPIPSGWFRVGFAEELAPGEVRPVRYFGEEVRRKQGKAFGA